MKSDTPAAKERPILFSAPMVRALLDGTKTQTRRIMKHQPAEVEYYLHGQLSDRQRGLPVMRDETGKGWAMCGPFKCPFVPEGMYAGENGKLANGHRDNRTDHRSLLWVKETWRACRSWDSVKPSLIEPHQAIRYEADEHEEGIPQMGWGKTRVSIFMPRAASRITLEVVSVRVERLQDISADDCRAEGHPTRPDLSQEVNDDAARDWYMDLWISLNGKASWDASPWVWVIEVKKLSPA